MGDYAGTLMGWRKSILKRVMIDDIGFPNVIWTLANKFTGHAGRYMTAKECETAYVCKFALAWMMGHSDSLSQNFYIQNHLRAKVTGVQYQDQEIDIEAALRPEEVIKKNIDEERRGSAFWTHPPPQVCLKTLAIVTDVTINASTETSRSLASALNGINQNGVVALPPVPSLAGTYTLQLICVVVVEVN